MSPAYIWIGNPENRRRSDFQRAADEAGVAHRVLSYETILSLLEHPAELQCRLTAAVDGLAAPVLRYEAAGKNVAVNRALAELGARLPSDARSFAAADARSAEPGRLGSPQLRYTGYACLLRRLDGLWTEVLRESTGRAPVYVNHPDDIITMASKPATHARFMEHGLPVPRKILAINSYEALLTEMQRNGLRSVFVKPAHGSSGAGIVALRLSNLPQPKRLAAYSTALLRDGEIYNTRRIQRYESETEIARIVDRLAREELHVEEWIPKPAPEAGRSADWRLLVIHGRARHSVLRLSRSPITNLHLLNERRYDAADAPTRATFEELAHRTAACFPRSLYFGLDVVLRRDGRPVILEANAFGDLLPGALHASQCTYAAELAAFPDFAALPSEANA